MESAKIGAQKDIERKEYLDWVKNQSQNDLIKVLVGFRRVGKSTVLKHYYRFLVEKMGFDRRNIFFVNFENDLVTRLRDVSQLRALFEQYRAQVAGPGEMFLFLDEIQNVRGWEKFVRTLYETSQAKYHIYLTGSNSSLLSSEFSSALSGRSIEKRIHPLSFREFLTYEGVPAEGTFWYEDNKEQVDRLLFKYLRRTSLPEGVDLEGDAFVSYMHAIFDKVLTDDIVKRYRVMDPVLLQDIFIYVVSNINHPVHATAIATEARRLGATVTGPTVTRYLRLFEQAFALSALPRFDWKTKRIFAKLNKYYAVDNGLVSTYGVSTKDLDGMLLENLVYNTLRRQEGAIYYGRDDKGKEIDFVVMGPKGICKKYQVCLNLNEGNIKREVGNFALVGKYLPDGDNMLVVRDGDDALLDDGGIKVGVVPLRKFLLQ